MAMRILFTSVPAPSHIDPLLHLARALATDHEVTVATGPALVPRVEDAGLPAIPVGLDWSEPEADRTFPELRDRPLTEMTGWWVRNIFFDRAAHPMAADVGALLDRDPFDLLVRTHIEFGGWAAAVARDLPQVVFQLGDMWTEEQLPVIADLLTPVLRRVDGRREVDPVSVYGDLSLLPFPESYEPSTPPVPTFRCRPPVGLPSADVPARPEVLDGSPDRPVVLATFGTVFNRVPGIFELVLDAVAGMDVTAVVTVGWTRDPDELGPVPDNVRIRRFVRYDDLLPHCAAVVSHGGFGTTMSALVHGLPVVTIPLGADQPWNAERTVALGVGLAVDFDGAAPAQVADALGTVIGDPAYRERARSYRDELSALPSWKETAARVAEVAGRTA